MKYAIRFLVVAFIVTSAASAQTPPSGEVPKLFDTMDVRVINIDVVVTDRKGNPITGLKKEDFEIYENGVPKTISNFYAVEGSKPVLVENEPEPSAAPAATPAPAAAQEISEQTKRRIIFYIDNLSLAPFNRNRVFKHMKEFVQNVMRPGDEAMVATFNRSMKVRVPFSRDTAQINQMFDSIMGESAMGTSIASERKQVQSQIKEAEHYESALAAARTYASSVEHDLRQSASSLNALMSTLAGLDGKKILVLTSEGFPMQPGRDAFYYVEEVAKEKNWNASGTLLEAMGFDSASLIQSIARTANANGITMYTVHAAGLQGADNFSAEHSQPTSFSVAQAAMSNTTESMQLMAEMTGGLASVQTNNYQLAFKRIQSDLDTYYSLGYRAGTERVDRQRRIDVRVKTKGYIVRNRETFVEKSIFAEMNDRVIANLLYRGKNNDLNVLMRMGTPIPTDDRDLFRVPVEVQIPMDSLTLLPQGEAEYVGGFDVYVAVANKEGDMSDVNRKAHQLRIPASDIGRAKGKYYTYALDLLMEKGLNRVSVGVVDQISNVTGFARDQIMAADLR